MILTADEYKSMGFPVLDEDELSGCVMRSCYVINAMTDGRAESTVNGGGEAAEMVKQAAGFEAYIMLREILGYKYQDGKSETSDSEKVTIGDYSYSTQRSESSSVETHISDADSLGINVVRLLRASGCMFSWAEVLE